MAIVTEAALALSAWAPAITGAGLPVTAEAGVASACYELQESVYAG